MSMKKMREIYFSLGNDGAYSSLSYLTRYFPRYKKWWKPFLQSQNTYNTTITPRRKFKRTSYINNTLHFNFQADLAFVSKIGEYDIAKENDNTKYLLVIIDTLSRFIYIYPLKSKNSDEVAKKFKMFWDNNPRKAIQLMTDKGSEFKKTCGALFKKLNISHYTGLNDATKASMVERQIREIKKKIWKYILHANSFRYIDQLPKIVNTLNSSINRSTGFRPNEVTKFHVPLIFKKTHNFIQKTKKPLFQLRDCVHIVKNLSYLGYKESKPSFTKEIFIVINIFESIPIQYQLSDFDNNIILGRFYTQELTRANLSSSTKHKFEILKETKNQVLISFENFPSSFNRWISKKSISRNFRN